MTIPAMFTISRTRLSLGCASLLLLACVEDDAELSTFSDSVERSTAGQQASLRTINLAMYPDAQCNDGSAPVVKVNLDPNGGSNWLVYLQGGGGCSSVDTCEDRWSDCDPSPAGGIGGKANMQANSNAMNFDNGGILDFDGHGGEASPFAGKGFNRVFIPYCSSDLWRGLGNTQAVNYPPTCGDPNPLTSIHFGGGKIVEAVIAEIMADQHAPQDGDFIVLAGGSAGGAGVQQNLDRVAAQAQAIEPGVTVVGIADASYSMGLDQDGIPQSPSLDGELFWAGLDPAAGHTPGDPIDVVVDDSCWNGESGADKDYCHVAYYTIPNYVDSPLMLTSNTYDDVGHGDKLTSLAAFSSECGVGIIDTGGVDPEQDDLYDEYCDPPIDPRPDLETWMRYQTGVEGTAILDTTTNIGYLLIHSSVGLHDQLLKQSDRFYRRATDPAALNPIGGYQFAGLGGWTSSSGQNADPSIASTVACALGLVGVPGSPACDLADVRVTSDLPTQVPVIEDYLNSR
jgi:hypothetical protein